MGPNSPRQGPARRDFQSEALTETVEDYRRQAKRLIALAAGAHVAEVKAELLELARRYETLATHAAERARGVLPAWWTAAQGGRGGSTRRSPSTRRRT